MSGFAGGGSCWGSVAEAADAACGATVGTTSAGVVSCLGVSSTSDTAAALALQWATPSGPVQQISVVQLPPCKAFDQSYYGPLIAAAFLACVLVLCARLAIRPLRREGF